MSGRLPLVLAITLLFASADITRAQEVQSPAEFLGYEIGERFTPHHRIVAYFEHVSQTSPFVHLEQYGETNEGRSLLMATISSAENLAKIDEIRENNLRLAGLADGVAEGDFPGIAWLSYGVHGNESSSSEAAMVTLYSLVSESNEVSSWLENTVVIMDPCLNPDGRDRYVNWFNMQVGKFPNSDVESREHVEPWPGGRANHYYFDLNRDWAWMTQKETKHRIAKYNQWMPHVHVDFHEQGINSPYYFAPASEPYHNLITDGQREIESMIGANNRQYFDANDWLYFTREQFDLLYPSYGDTWPTFNGAIGMTYEQAGGGRSGLLAENDQDHVLTLAERVDHHHTAGLSTIETVSTNRDKIIQEFVTYYSSAMDGIGPYKTYVMSRESGADNVDALAALLEAQGIDFGWATEASTISGFVYRDGDDGRFRVEAGDLVVNVAQPKSRLATVLLEPQTFVADSVTYDITSWALPYAYNLDAVATNATVQSSSTPPAKPGRDIVDESYAYLLTWNGVADVQVLSQLLARDVKIRFATNPFTIGQDNYEAGTLIITGADNGHYEGSLGNIVRSITEEYDQPVASIQSGFVDSGNDFGSNAVDYLNAPKVMIVTGNSLSSYGVGVLWHYFDNVIGYPASLIDVSNISRVTLSDYDVIILPSGSYANHLKDDMDSISGWVRQGGTLIAIESAVQFLSDQSGFNISLKPRASESDTTAASKLKIYGDRVRDRQSDSVRGAIYASTIDSTHPLGFGYGKNYFSLKRSSSTYDYLDSGWNVATIQDGTTLSGFAGQNTPDRIAESLVWGHQTLGTGDVIYFTDDPVYRGFWHSSMLALANAVFLVGQ